MASAIFSALIMGLIVTMSPLGFILAAAPASAFMIKDINTPLRCN
jgi:hypothetical protein